MVTVDSKINCSSVLLNFGTLPENQILLPIVDDFIVLIECPALHILSPGVENTEVPD
jgi:hypothetical protein